MSIDTIRPWRSVARRTTNPVYIGKVAVGGDNPIVVHASTDVRVSDYRSVLKQINACVDIGADIMCIPCDSIDTAKRMGDVVFPSPVPIIAEIVDNSIKTAITALNARVQAIKINPMQMGNMNPVIEAIQHNTAIILDIHLAELSCGTQDSIKTCLHIVDSLENAGFTNTILSLQSDDIFQLYESYMEFAFTCRTPVHLSLKNYGTMIEDSIRGAMTLGNLLWAGIGDILHIKLNAPPVEQIKTAYSILKSLGLRHRGVNVISCPSCARQAFDVVKTVTLLEQRLEHISTPLTLSVLGCIVNGIGEAQHTDIGFIGGGKNTHQVYMNGLPSHRLKDEDLIQHIVGLVEQKAQEIENQNL